MREYLSAAAAFLLLGTSATAATYGTRWACASYQADPVNGVVSGSISDVGFEIAQDEPMILIKDDQLLSIESGCQKKSQIGTLVTFACTGEGTDEVFTLRATIIDHGDTMTYVDDDVPLTLQRCD